MYYECHCQLTRKTKEKQLKYERKMLRELSLKTLRSNIRDAFQMQELHRQYEDYCIELGIESYLLERDTVNLVIMVNRF